MILPLKGIIPPIITPLKSDSEIDEDGLKKLIEHLIKGGVHGVFLLGTTGEAPNLNYELRKQFIRKACSHIRKRIPVVVGITDTVVKYSLEMANAAKDAGADAVVISAPYYIPMTQNEMVLYLEEIVPQLPLPFLMYNMPSCTGLHMSLDTVRKAKQMGAIGIKDSSGDLQYLYSLIEEFRDTPEFSIIAGTELFIPETMKSGGHGCVPGGANVFPETFVALYEASLQNDEEKIDILLKKLNWIEENIYNIGDFHSRYFKSIKCALSAMNICEDYVAMPFRKFNSDQKEKIVRNLKEIGILNSNPAKNSRLK